MLIWLRILFQIWSLNSRDRDREIHENISKGRDRYVLKYCGLKKLPKIMLRLTRVEFISCSVNKIDGFLQWKNLMANSSWNFDQWKSRPLTSTECSTHRMSTRRRGAKCFSASIHQLPSSLDRWWPFLPGCLTHRRLFSPMILISHQFPLMRPSLIPPLYSFCWTSLLLNIVFLPLAILGECLPHSREWFHWSLTPCHVVFSNLSNLIFLPLGIVFTRNRSFPISVLTYD
jgi:hypothetical protein